MSKTSNPNPHGPETREQDDNRALLDNFVHACADRVDPAESDTQSILDVKFFRPLASQYRRMHVYRGKDSYDVELVHQGKGGDLPWFEVSKPGVSVSANLDHSAELNEVLADLSTMDTEEFEVRFIHDRADLAY